MPSWYALIVLTQNQSSINKRSVLFRPQPTHSATVVGASHGNVADEMRTYRFRCPKAVPSLRIKWKGWVHEIWWSKRHTTKSSMTKSPRRNTGVGSSKGSMANASIGPSEGSMTKPPRRSASRGRSKRSMAKSPSRSTSRSCSKGSVAEPPRGNTGSEGTLAYGSNT